ncbi:MAG: 50S ribosomal protein L32 [Planctomycetota bacterium]
MAQPKYRLSRARKGKRRAHHALVLSQPHNCSNCGTPSQSHRVCLACGYYNGRKIIEVGAVEA